MNQKDLDAIAEKYHLGANIEDKFIEDLCQEFFCGWIKENFQKNLACCEMGFGEGITAKILHKYFENYSVVEGSPKLVEMALNRIPDLKIDCHLFEKFKPASSYDLVLALHVLEHVDCPNRILDIIKKWLTPKGKIIILVPNKKSLHRIFAKGMGLIEALDTLSLRDHEVGHQRVYDFESLESDLNNSDLRIDMKKGFFLKPLPNSMMTSFDPRLILEFNKASSNLPDDYLANICVVASLK